MQLSKVGGIIGVSMFPTEVGAFVGIMADSNKLRMKRLNSVYPFDTINKSMLGDGNGHGTGRTATIQWMTVLMLRPTPVACQRSAAVAPANEFKDI